MVLQRLFRGQVGGHSACSIPLTLLASRDQPRNPELLMPLYDIHLQPKQAELLDLIEYGRATVIGVGGGRGAAKSAGADRVLLALMMEQPGMVGCVVMRNADQVRKYHIEPIKRDFPILEDFIHGTDKKLTIPAGKTRSELDFSYAENLEDVKRRFRSANYRYIIIDQAEQFTWEEISEIGLANRSKGKQKAKLILLFNMGGIGIEALRDHFSPIQKFNENEDPDDYAFLHVFPWDNVEWSRAELEADGLTEDDYYGWTDQERFTYFTTRSPYGRKLNGLDDATRNRDLLGGWNAIEGAFFSGVYDYKSTMKAAEIAEAVIRPWDSRWMSTDWGKTHFCSSHWHGKSLLSPSEVKKWLGWEVTVPLNVVSTYRRMIVNEQTSTQVGRALVNATPVNEREKVKRYFLSPDAFADKDAENTTADLITAELRKFSMPVAEEASNGRKVGWGLMSTLLNNTRIWAKAPADRTSDELLAVGDTVWIISTECPEILDAIPLLMRNPKDLDDVIKTDLSMTDKKMDVADDCRYGLLSMLNPGKKPEKVKHAENLIRILNTTGDRQAMTMAEISFRAMQAKGEFQVSGRRRAKR